ncbi:helix-turn-helix domain-containing protein [Phytohabitans suffuscus]|uniref:Winged helix-turn helix domain-containing protein n=1 Tax=Phytohabitans suffuscus TaxID=624315 RepID=A0A6F8YP02_9ACTN|nr:winged helix-turn-helix domain-containing protein [Phytohabitans suffuscus]BCB87867.1 hypothetical protein Psuf_051800 [Phytohabitans suffuscus]
MRLELGPAAAGYGEDQRWTPAQIAALAGAMFKVRVSVTTLWEAMRRIGYSAQMPTHRAIERGEEAVARWRRYQWPAVNSRGQADAWICFADDLRPAKAATWSPCGRTLVVKVAAKGGVRGLGGRAGLLPARSPQPADLSHPDPPRPAKVIRRASANGSWLTLKDL